MFALRQVIVILCPKYLESSICSKEIDEVPSPACWHGDGIFYFFLIIVCVCVCVCIAVYLRLALPEVRINNKKVI